MQPSALVVLEVESEFEISVYFLASYEIAVFLVAWDERYGRWRVLSIQVVD